MNRKISTPVLAIIACVLWATAFPALKIGLKYTTPIAFAGLRFIISGLMILPFSGKPSGYIQTIRNNWRLMAILTLIQGFIHYIFFYTGINMVPGALGAIITGGQPLIIALIASLMITSEPMTLRRIVTLIIGLSGVFLVSIGRQALKIGTGLELVGALLVFGSNFTSAFGNIIVSRNARHINPFVLSSFTLLAGGLSLFIFSIPVEGFSMTKLPGEYWLSLFWLGFLSAVAFSIWYKTLQRPGVKVSDLNLWKFIIPVIGAILSWMIVPGERPDILTVTGMIIIAGSLIAFFYRRPSKRHTPFYRTEP